MKIGIHAGAAFSEKKTGVEEYTYQLIYWFDKLKQAKEHKFYIYINPKINLDIPSFSENFFVKKIENPFFLFWTNFAFLKHVKKDNLDALFLPANLLQRKYPKNTTVTIHGVEFEFLKKFYSKKDFFYLKNGTKNALKNAEKIISVSENTKKDLVDVYGADPKKISVVKHGVSLHNDTIIQKQAKNKKEKYILYIGRIELKKNIQGVLSAFDIAKQKFKIPHKLFLLGGEGFGYSQILKLAQRLISKNDIYFLGYRSNEEKYEFLKNADIFLFPSFYEGFGMPILEAQSFGVPVITSNTSSMPEVAGEGALFVNPNNKENIAKALAVVAFDKKIREKLKNIGIANAQNYSWKKCAEETLNIITK